MDSYIASFSNTCENRKIFSVIKGSDRSREKSTRKDFCEEKLLDSLFFIFFNAELYVCENSYKILLLNN